MSPLDRDLARALDAYSVPPLSAGFADRVTAMALSGQSLPAAKPLRRTGRTRWMPRHRVAFGLVAGALMSATAAAAGVFGDLGVTIPALRQMAERISLVAPAEPAAAPQRRAAVPITVDASPATAPAAAPVGPALTPEQLEVRFRATDERRDARRAMVTERIETAVDRGIERREAAGLPVPTPEQRGAVRARIQQRVAERDAVASERREANRDALRDVVRERQMEGPGAQPPAPVQTPPPVAAVPPPVLPAQGAAPAADSGEAADPAAERGPVLTPAQREALRQRRAERMERLRRLRRTQ